MNTHTLHTGIQYKRMYTNLAHQLYNIKLRSGFKYSRITAFEQHLFLYCI